MTWVYIWFEYLRWIENQFGRKLSSEINVSDLHILIFSSNTWTWILLKINILFVYQFTFIRGQTLNLESFTCLLIPRYTHLSVPSAPKPFPASGCLLSLLLLGVCSFWGHALVSTPVSLLRRGFPSHWLGLTTPSFKTWISVGLRVIYLSHICGLVAHERQGLGLSRVPLFFSSRHCTWYIRRWVSPIYLVNEGTSGWLNTPWSNLSFSQSTDPTLGEYGIQV